MSYNGETHPINGTINGSLSKPSILSGSLSTPESLKGSISEPEALKGFLSVPPVGPVITTVDYETQVNNKPSINTYTIEGHKTGADYKLQDKMKRITEQDIDRMIYGG